MRIGILSDSHGKSNRLRRALKALEDLQVDAVVHCGDIVRPRDVAALGAFTGRAYLVAGNMDRHNVSELAEAAKAAGVEFAEDFLAVPLGAGRHLAVTHGHRETLLEELILGGQYDYVCHGHSHRQREERKGSTRIFNPGALYQPRGTDQKTFLVLDTQTDTVKTLVL